MPFPEDLNTTSLLMPSAAGVLDLRPEAKGDDSSGWRVDSVRLEPFSPVDPIRQLRVSTSADCRKKHMFIAPPQRAALLLTASFGTGRVTL